MSGVPTAAKPGARLASRLYGLFLYAYPAAFRVRYRDELMATFEAGLADARGALARLLYLIGAFAGALGNGAAERAARPRLLRGVSLDVRSGARSLWRRPGFVLATALPVALGVGGVTAVFAIMDGVLLRPLPYPASHELVQVGRPLSNGVLAPVSTANFIDIEDSVPGLTLAVVMGGRTVARGVEPELLNLTRPSRKFMEVFGVAPVLGRSFVHEDYENPRVAILTWAYWQRVWGGDPEAIGKTVETDQGSYRIVGVLPRTWQPPEALVGARGEVWIPLDYASPTLESTRAFGFTNAVGRLQQGAALQAVNEKLRAAAMGLWEQYPEANAERDGTAKLLEARSLHAETVGDIGRRIGMLLGAVGFLLAIACANVANLFMVRGTERQREIAMRTALGAGRRRLVTQLLVECVAVALLGGMVGIALAYTSIDALVALTPDLPRAQAVAVDMRVVATAFAVSLLCGVAFGVLPALTTSQRDPGAVLRGGSQPALRTERLRGALVIGQTALALALVAGGGLLVNSVVRLAMVDLGFRTAGVLTVRPLLTAYIQSDDDAMALPFYAAFSEALAAIPGVERISAGMFLPGEGLPVQVTVEHPDTGESLPRWRNTVMPGFFDILDIPLVEGRSFAPSDRAGAARVAVVSRSLARELWPDRSAVGRTVVADDGRGGVTFTVIGVVEDVRNRGAHEEPEPVLYESFVQNPWLATLAVMMRYQGDPAVILPAVREALRRADPAVPLGAVVPLADLAASHTVEERHYALLLSTFSIIALIIAGVGVYATISYTVTRRLRELAIRMAMGARGADVMRLVVRRGMVQTGIGVVLGCGLAVAATGVLDGLLFGITPTDPMTFLLAGAVLLVVTLVACLIPAVHAARVDPLNIMRTG